MSENKTKWIPVRSLYSTSFQIVPKEQVYPGNKVWVEHGDKSSTDYKKATEYAEQLTNERKCAEWEFDELVRDFANKASSLASNQKYFPNGIHPDVKDEIYAVIQMARSMSQAMVAKELLTRKLKK